eukprot:5252001-Pyramimonas_sp.AAC.1
MRSSQSESATCEKCRRPFLLLLTFFARPVSAWVSHQDARSDIAAEVIPTLLSASVLCEQLLYSSSVSVHNKSLSIDHQGLKEMQHKRDPYRPSHSPLFDDPSLGAGEAAPVANLSRDRIKGYFYGHHSQCSDDDVN